MSIHDTRQCTSQAPDARHPAPRHRGPRPPQTVDASHLSYQPSRVGVVGTASGVILLRAVAVALGGSGRCPFPGLSQKNTLRYFCVGITVNPMNPAVFQIPSSSRVKLAMYKGTPSRRSALSRTRSEWFQACSGQLALFRCGYNARHIVLPKHTHRTATEAEARRQNNVPPS